MVWEEESQFVRVTLYGVGIGERKVWLSLMRINPYKTSWLSAPFGRVLRLTAIWMDTEGMHSRFTQCNAQTLIPGGVA